MHFDDIFKIMRKTIVTVLLAAFAVAAMAMPKEQAIRQVAEANSSLSTLESDFEQERTIKMMNRTVESAGRLYFDRAGRLNMTYSTPKGDLKLINGNRFIVRSGGKTNSFDTEKNVGMRLLRNALLNSFRGDVKTIAEENAVQLEYEETGGCHVFTVMSGNKRQQYNGFIIRYDTKTMRLVSLTITEANGNSTDYTLTGEAMVNAAIDGTVFDVSRIK